MAVRGGAEVVGVIGMRLLSRWTVQGAPVTCVCWLCDTAQVRPVVGVWHSFAGIVRFCAPNSARTWPLARIRAGCCAALGAGQATMGYALSPPSPVHSPEMLKCM